MHDALAPASFSDIIFQSYLRIISPKEPSLSSLTRIQYTVLIHALPVLYKHRIEATSKHWLC